MKLGEPLPVRVEKIKALRSTPTSQNEAIEFQGRRQNFPIYTVSIDFPKYRLDNGRTRSMQAAYLANHPELPKDFFRRDLENDQAQKAQHQILLKMLGGEDSNKNLLKYFKSHEQTQRFILSDLGYIINGNRRLCAFRELIQEDSVAFKKFQNIEVIILPPADDKDIDRLEAQLQITDEIKADYSWTAQAFMWRERRDNHGFSEKELANIYEKSEPDIRELLDMLSLAEEYLEDRDKPYQYQDVEKSEYAFRQLRKNRQKFKDDEAAKDVFDRLAYCLIDQPTEGRVYAAIPDIAKYFERITDQIKEEIPVDKVEHPSGGFSDLLGSQPSNYTDLAQALTHEEHYGKVRDVISDVIESEKSKFREDKKEVRVISSITRAAQNLEDAVTDWDENTLQAGISDQLDRIDVLVASLREKLT